MNRELRARSHPDRPRRVHHTKPPLTHPAPEIAHIVIWKLKPFDSPEHEQRVKAGIAELKNVAGPEHMTVGPPAIEGRNQGYNWGLYSVFPSREALDKYSVSEHHVRVVNENIKGNFTGGYTSRKWGGKTGR